MKKFKRMTALLLSIMLVLGACGAPDQARVETQAVESESGAAEEAGEEEALVTAKAVEDPESGEETSPEEAPQEEDAAEPAAETEGEAVFEESEEGVILNAYKTDDMASLDVPEPEGEEGEIKEVNEEEMNRARSTLLYNNASLFYYYTKLNKGQKKMYRRLLNVLRYPDSNEVGKAFKIKAEPGSKKYSNWFSKVYMALQYDHPELFWFFSGDNGVSVWHYYSRYPDAKGRYTYQFFLKGTYKNYKKEVTAFYDAVDSVMKGLDKKAPKAKLALQVHDRLLDLCDYNDEAYAQRGSSFYSNNYCHTAYGALVKDSSGRWNKPVCDGYSMAYEFILQQLGFYVTVVSGDAGGSRSDATGHAWNAVYLNGNWYEVDVTWDDIDPDSSWNRCEAGRLAAKDSAYMRKVRHYLFLVSTDYITDFTDGPSFRYRLRNGAWFQAMGNSVHIRRGKSKTELFSEAPWCAGGKFFHGQNI